MADSFYGGKQGFSFILSGSFPDVQTMITKFKEGPRYTDIRFDEYVIIDSLEDGEKGRIYRRGYDCTNDMGGAIYVGTIAGPAGPAPWMKYLATPEAVKDKTSEVNPSEKVEGEINFDLAQSNLVPGKVGPNEYNDDIKGYYCTVKTSAVEDGAKENEKTVYIGFKVPYTVFDFTASSVDAYTTGNLTVNNSSAEHPFYSNWNIKIPKGKKGDSIENLRIIVPTAEDNIQTIDDAHASELQYAIEYGAEVLVCDFKNYDSNAEGVTSTFYIGSWNTIKDISLSDEGLFLVSYTGDKPLYRKSIVWPANMELDTNTGSFKITYNNGRVYSHSLVWPTDVSLKEDGDFVVSYVNGQEASRGRITWPTRAELNEANQVFMVSYSDGRVEMGPSINYIENTVIRPDNYHYLVEYSSGKMKELQAAGQVLVTYQGKEWVDLGPVRSYEGVVVGLNLPETSADTGDLSTQTNALAYLNSQYKFGLGYDNGGNKTNDILVGKVVSIGSSNKSKKVYAYDYGTFGKETSSHWFYLRGVDEDIAAVDPGEIQMVYENPSNWQDSEFQSKTNTLSDGGIWWILES